MDSIVVENLFSLLQISNLETQFASFAKPLLVFHFYGKILRFSSTWAPLQNRFFRYVLYFHKSGACYLIWNIFAFEIIFLERS